VKAQLVQVQEALDDVRKANTDMPVPNNNRVFTMLMQCLAKARKLLQAIEGYCDVPSDHIVLGKRQRTEYA
jgi:hypothetical protein